MIEIVAERVNDVASELFVVSASGNDYSSLGFRVYPDAVLGAGSLGGIYTALRCSQFDFCLVVACDMPLLNPSLLQHMASLPRDYDVLVPSLSADRSDQGSTETLETLHAIYAKSAMPIIEANIRSGKLKIADAIPELRVRRLRESELRRFDPELKSVFNINDRRDLAVAVSRLG